MTSGRTIAEAIKDTAVLFGLANAAIIGWQCIAKLDTAHIKYAGAITRQKDVGKSLL